KAPDFVLEITSRSTRSRDQGAKRGIYAFLGVREYVQYDPTQDYLTPPLKGFQLVGDNYEALPLTSLPNGTSVLHSAVLGLDLQLDRGALRFVDPASGQRLLTYREAELARRAASIGISNALLPQSRRVCPLWVGAATGRLPNPAPGRRELFL